MYSFPRRIRAGHAVAGLLFVALHADAATFTTYVTGDSPLGDTIFRVTLDPAAAFSASIGVAATDTVRMDGIDFLPGSTSLVAVGAQGPGEISQFNVATGAKLGSFIPATGAGTRPSTVLSTPTHVYYIENQFGFEGPTHRIMRTPIGGPPGTAEVVFDGASEGLVNFEGIEIVGGRLYFFARDPGDPASRALFSIGLAGGVWDTAAPVAHLTGLAAAPAGDGPDELDFDPGSGLLFGTNIVTGEIYFWNPGLSVGGLLISSAEIGAGAGGLARLGTSMIDGIRSSGNGYLVVTGLAGVIASIDIAGALAGVDDSDVIVLYDAALGGPSISFDDLSPLTPTPEPSTFYLGGLALAGLALIRRRG
ncbi:MAG: hypothetical protein R2762_16060 [Bryobacteraceae bacterium]